MDLVRGRHGQHGGLTVGWLLGLVPNLLVVPSWVPLLGLALATLYFYDRLAGRLVGHLPVKPPAAVEDDRLLEAGPPAMVDEYLRRFQVGLDLPPGLAGDVVREMRDHIEDSSQALVDEGLDATMATREALERLGAPEDVALEIRRAHQTGRRMLAGAAGGVFATPGSFVAGWVIGMVAYLPAVFAAGLVLPLAGAAAYESTKQAVDPVLLMGALAIASFYASRTGVRVFAGISHRSFADIARAWAAIGTPLVAALMLVGFRGHQSLPLVTAELAVPIAFAAGALFQIDRVRMTLPGSGRLGSPVWTLAAAGAVFGLVAGTALVVASPAGAAPVEFPLGYSSSSGQVLNIDLAGTMPPPSQLLYPEGWDYGTVPGMEFRCHSSTQYSGPSTSATVDCTYFVMNSPTSRPFYQDLDQRWTGLRLEAWPGVSGGIRAGSQSPMATATATHQNESPTQAEAITASFRIAIEREVTGWSNYWIVLTGIGPDGHRYRLANGAGLTAEFYGNAWDWLTAPG